MVVPQNDVTFKCCLIQQCMKFDPTLCGKEPGPPEYTQAQIDACSVEGILFKDYAITFLVGIAKLDLEVP